MKLISPESHDVRMIGICGMGGIGKTTIATAAYEYFFDEFEGSSFLANVREKSEKGDLVSLQKMLLSEILNMKKDEINIYNEFGGRNMIIRRLRCKKVLIVIDDVNHLEQLEKLVGKHDWFGMGSRIIITSRDKGLLTSHGVHEVYEAEILDDDEALQLFISKAFKKHQPSENFKELSKRVAKYAGGLPLALKVLGSFLCGKEVHIWEDALERLKSDCNKEILDILQISFDGLEESEKQIFLDIACFFKGMDRYYVTRILESCGFFPIVGIDTLIDKSLIIILDEDTLWMHDLLQQMGQQIVKRESHEPGKRSRLWIEADIYHVLTENTGTESVQGIILNFSKEEIRCCAKTFLKMVNLRLLKIRNVQLPEGLDYLSNNLRLLDWEGYPLKSLPPNLQLDKIIELKMDKGCIEQLQQAIKPFNNLESISFEESEYLIKTPDFTSAPNLKTVNFTYCEMLHDIHPSLFVHKKITDLYMSYCTSLTTLPNQIHMESLRSLQLSFCYKLENFPEIVGSMDCLSVLGLQETAIKVLPKSIELWSGLTVLEIDGSSKLDNLEESLGQLRGLACLSAKKTTIRQPPFWIRNLKCLYFSGCIGPPSDSLFSLSLKTFRLPTLSSCCRSLQELELSDCNMEEEAIPNDFFASFSSLEKLDLSKNNFVSLLGSIKHLSKLEDLSFYGCKRLRSLPELPSNIKYIKVDGCVALETSSNALRLCNSKLSHFSCLNCLKLICCNNLATSMPKEFLTAMSRPNKDFSMAIPGSEIPEWFQHQSETSSMKIERPPDSYDNKIAGYAVCCVFDIHEYNPDLYPWTYLISSRVSNRTSTPPHVLSHEILDKAPSHHLWLFYYSAERLDQDFVEFSIESHCPGLAVHRCGIYPVYEKELKELKSRTNKSSSSSFWNSYELDEDFLGSTVDVDCEGSEDEPISKTITSPNFLNGISSSR